MKAIQRSFKQDKYHQLAQEIILRVDEEYGADKKEFTQKLLDEYGELARSKTNKYTQDWAAYNQAQTREKNILINILDELLSYIPFKETKKVGRNPVPIRDKIFYVVLQSYNEKSSRRCISDLEIARKLNYIEKTPHFNTVLKILKDPTITKYLKHLIKVSGVPLQQVESDFAVDSSGFSTSLFGRWLDVRASTKSKQRKFLKAHITCGVKTNIITAVNVTTGYSADSKEFESLVRETNEVFDIKEVSADKAYSSRQNLHIVDELGGIPFIPFKANTRRNTRSLGKPIWKRMFLFFTKYPDEFAHHYHKRSNVETVFHMVKRKFGSHLRSRTREGQINELLAKCLCHNLCVLIQEAFELGIDIDFKKCAKYEIAHN